MVQRRRNTQVRQKQIVDAARRLIIKYGSEHVTARRIANEIGISEAAIYRHFKSKRDILALLVDHIEENLIGDIERSKTLTTSPMERLDKVLRNLLSSIEKRRGVSFQVIAEIVSLGDKKLNRKIVDTINRYTDSLSKLLEEAVKAGEVRDDIDLNSTAMLLFSMLQGLTTIWTLNNYKFNPEQNYISLWKILSESIIKH